MKIYTSGNAAKQWILSQLHEQFGDSAFRILDLGCGAAFSWKAFLQTHQNVRYVGYDYDRIALERGRKDYDGMKNVVLNDGDAQTLSTEIDVDVVTAFSAIEHVVDRPAFLQTVFTSLKSGGFAYLNFDDGHFRSYDLKERLMVPVSQLLALFGFQGPYMKHVDDALFRSQAERAGFRFVALRKHNIFPLKGFMKGASPEAVRAWYEFEEQMNELYTPEQLDKIKWSTTLVLQKV